MSNTRTVTLYLVLERNELAWQGRGRARVIRHSKNTPELARGQCAVKVTLSVPDEAFEPILTAPEPLTFTVENTFRAKAEVVR